MASAGLSSTVTIGAKLVGMPSLWSFLNFFEQGVVPADDRLFRAGLGVISCSKGLGLTGKYDLLDANLNAVGVRSVTESSCNGAASLSLVVADGVSVWGSNSFWADLGFGEPAENTNMKVNHK